jgi:hypothetical protein
MVDIGAPRIDTRPARTYMGLRTVTPFKGMSKVEDGLRRQMNAWAQAKAIQASGPPFLRYHAIDMRGEMDISYCIPVPAALPDSGEIRAGELPAGRYASLVYCGGGISGNRALIEWVRSQGLEFDRWDTEQGDIFRGRCETFLTDPRVEPRKSRWRIEVAIKLKDIG